MIKAVLRWLLALIMVGGGVNHFLSPAPYVAMMPSALPWHLPLVYLSGVFEILGGAESQLIGRSVRANVSVSWLGRLTLH